MASSSVSYMPYLNKKPSDFSQFAATVWMNSATTLEFSDYLDIYVDVLHVLFFNPDVDDYPTQQIGDLQ